MESEYEATQDEHIKFGECECPHATDLEELETVSASKLPDGPECRHEKVVPVMSWKKEGAREMSFRFFCLTCKIQFVRTIQPEDHQCGKCGESYFYYPYSPA